MRKVRFEPNQDWVNVGGGGRENGIPLKTTSRYCFVYIILNKKKILASKSKKSANVWNMYWKNGGRMSPISSMALCLVSDSIRVFSKDSMHEKSAYLTWCSTSSVIVHFYI